LSCHIIVSLCSFHHVLSLYVFKLCFQLQCCIYVCCFNKKLHTYLKEQRELSTKRCARIVYKIAVLTFKVLHDSAPRYLGPLVTVADLPGRRALRSASTSRLVIQPIKLSTVGSRAFPVAAAQVCNGLPKAVISSSSLQSFRRQLKSYLFQLLYPHLIL